MKLLLTLCSLSALTACGHHDSAVKSPPAPINHRIDGAQCSTAVPAGNESGRTDGSTGPLFTCSNDSDCTAGMNGRCVGFGGPASAGCVYDACANDAACPAHQTCACHGSAYMTAYGSACVPSNCRTDGDCGEVPGYCSPSATLGMCGNSVAGYFCHTTQDQCINDGDCASQEICVYATAEGRWVCQGPVEICV